jgi:hypothetical protein
MVHDFVGEAWQARVWGRAAELVISSDPDPCVLRIDYYLEDSLLLVSLSVIDSAGRTVRTFERTTSEGGHHLAWDGSDDERRATPYGEYRVRLETPADTLWLTCWRVRRPPLR